MRVSEAAYEGHCRHIDRALSRFEDGQFDEALAELDMALEFCDSPNARWNRAQALLALGRYREGWDGYAARWQLFPGAATERGAQLRRDLPEWRGERLRGKRLVVIHEAGLGDTIMLLRLVKRLRSDAAHSHCQVALEMPPELARLAGQVAPMAGEVGERDVQCSTFDLPRLLGITPATVPAGPYLQPELKQRQEWQYLVAGEQRLKVGIAWSTTRRTARSGRSRCAGFSTSSAPTTRSTACRRMTAKRPKPTAWPRPGMETSPTSRRSRR